MTYIIAEIGVNHGGDYNTAVFLVDAAVRAGVDAVKFQHFFAEKQAKGNLATHAMLQPLQMSIGNLQRLKDLCDELGVEFMCTGFCEETLAEIAPLVKRFKIGSGQVKDLDFVRAVAAYDKPTILSNGMCTHNEMNRAISCFRFYTDITVLDCVSLYPTPIDAISTAGMATLRGFFPEVSVGYSCHAGNIWPTVVAAAKGAGVVEAHITFSRSAPGPDHSSSIEVGELATWVKQIRAVSQ